MAKKLNSRGEELFTTAFKLFKSKGKATEMAGNVIVKTQKNGDFTILTSSQRIQGQAMPVKHEEYRDVFPYRITVTKKNKGNVVLFRTEWSTYVLKVRMTLVKRSK